MYVLLLVIGIVLVFFGALVLIKRSEGAGAALAVLGIVMMALGITVSNKRSPSPPEVPMPPTSASAPTITPQTPAASVREAVLIGDSENHLVSVAIAIKGDRAAGYLCDGNKIEAWLEGTMTGDQVDLRGKRGAALTGTVFSDATVSFGRVIINSEQLQYHAKIAPNPAGLYEGKGNVDGVDNRIGWIVLPDGSQIGVRNVNGERSPAPRLDPGQLKADGLQIPVKSVDGDDDAVPGQ